MRKNARKSNKWNEKKALEKVRVKNELKLKFKISKYHTLDE